MDTTVAQPRTNYYFLQGGGELGELTRCYDWASTTVGDPGSWPHELRLSISMLLNSIFPMVLFWGEEQICFYNDAFRAILGKEGRHPGIGKKAIELWADTWDFGGPLLQSVQESGKPQNYENILVPISRNGAIEDAYWTLSASPVFNAHDKVNGVLVICSETTSEVSASRKKQAEIEQRLRDVIDAAPFPIGIYTGDEMHISYANRSIIDAWGKGTDIIGKTFLEVLPEFKEEEFPKQLEKVYKTGKPFSARNIRVDFINNGVKETKYFNYDYTPLFDTNGEVYGVMNTAAEVTDLNKIKVQLEDSEQQVRSIIDSAPFPIGVYTGPEKTIAFANRSIMDVWGKGYDVIGRTYTEILPELENQLIFEQITGVYETGTPFHARNQRVDLVVDDKLQSYWFNYSFTPLFDAEEGKVYGVMNTAAEVTDLNRAKQKIEESERNLRNIILQAPMATCIYRGEQYVIEIANNAMFDFWGVEPDVVLNKPLFEALPDVRNQGFEEILNNVRDTGIPFIANEMLATLKRDGVPTDVYINFSLEPIKDIDGTISGIMAVAIDVNAQVIARRKIEEIVAERTAELALANQNLQRSNAELEQFAYIASHDLQEPLRKVGTFAQMLESSMGDNIPDRAKGYIDKINTSTERMTVLIRDVLHYSQLSKDEKQAFKPVNLNSLLEGIKMDYELLISQKNAQVIVGDLPTIDASTRQMSQLFSNLVSNALKFAKEDQPTVVEINAELLKAHELPASLIAPLDTNYYKIQVTDNGIGFDQYHADKIFNIFQRLHAKTEYSGTGIGLAMCKKIVTNHHGDIYATSEPGKGATFTIILPEKQ